MAGILANSSSVTMVSGDTAADNTSSGYVTNEQISLSVTPTGSAYVWALSKPEGATSRSDLSDTDAATCTFTPDVGGDWVVSLVVDSVTTYVLRASVTTSAVAYSYDAMRFPPRLNSTVPTPATGVSVFMSDDSDLLSFKTTAGTVRAIEPRVFTPTDTNDATGVTGDTARDSDYFYVKTAAGWKRAALSTF